jgi:AcrR family transcriptional regulator
MKRLGSKVNKTNKLEGSKKSLPAIPNAEASGPRQGSDLKETLLETTVELLKTKSPADISLREIARLSGVSEAAPYRHFKDKESLLAAISARGFDTLRELLVQTVATDHPPKQRFIDLGLAYLEMGLKYPQHLRLMFGPFISPSEEHMELFVAGKKAFLTLVKIVQDGQKAGVIGGGDPFHRALHCWMMVHGFTMLVIDFKCAWLGVGPESARPAMEMFCHDMLAGMSQSLNTESGPFKLSIPEIPLEILRQVGFSAKIVLE